MKLLKILIPLTKIKKRMCIGSYDKWFALNHAKILQIYFCVKRQVETNDFLKDVERRVDLNGYIQIKYIKVAIGNKEHIKGQK